MNWYQWNTFDRLPLTFETEPRPRRDDRGGVRELLPVPLRPGARAERDLGRARRLLLRRERRRRPRPSRRSCPTRTATASAWAAPGRRAAAPRRRPPGTCAPGERSTDGHEPRRLRRHLQEPGVHARASRSATRSSAQGETDATHLLPSPPPRSRCLRGAAAPPRHRARPRSTSRLLLDRRQPGRRVRVRARWWRRTRWTRRRRSSRARRASPTSSSRSSASRASRRSCTCTSLSPGAADRAQGQTRRARPRTSRLTRAYNNLAVPGADGARRRHRAPPTTAACTTSSCAAAAPRWRRRWPRGPASSRSGSATTTCWRRRCAAGRSTA